MYVVNLIFDVPLRQHYSYLSQQLVIQGQRVVAQLRNKKQIGFVAKCIPIDQFSGFPIDKLQPIVHIYPQTDRIPADIWQLCEFTARYYHHPLGNTLFCAIPSLLRKINNILIEPLEDTTNYQLTTRGIQKPPKGIRQYQLWQQLKDLNQLNHNQIRQSIGTNPHNLLAKWLSTGIIEKQSPESPATFINQILINTEQQQIVTAISKELGRFYSALIYGITGSGKTEVFMQLIHKVLSNNDQALILVPEINLTPQLFSRFQSRFPHARILLLNSEISDKQRFNIWHYTQTNKINIILGTRLSVFTPFKQLGIIIVDEEHDASFKQNDGLRYNARDLAIYRAKQLNIPVVLASATPSLETLYNYRQGKHKLYKLTKRAVAAALLPEIKLVNLNHYPANHAGISAPVLAAINECIRRQEIALVFINRRGYAPILSCYDCGWVSQCQNCSSKMVYHHNSHNLKCHHCGAQTLPPMECPQCHTQYLHTIGHGTQKLEEFLTQTFPLAQIRRVDRDTTTRKDDWQQLYQDISDNKVNILVGTQMLAKGHDFPNLTLVIGLNTDSGLFSYDFRASEDMFCMLTQVAGRAGRADKPGLVLLQTNFSDNPVYHYLKQHDFEGFINFTLKERKQNYFPPFYYQALIKLSSHQERFLISALSQLTNIANSIPHSDITLFAAVPAVMYKLHKRYRGQMLISSHDRSKLHDYLQQLEQQLPSTSNVAIAIDVDPLEV